MIYQHRVTFRQEIQAHIIAVKAKLRALVLYLVCKTSVVIFKPLDKHFQIAPLISDIKKRNRLRFFRCLAFYYSRLNFFTHVGSLINGLATDLHFELSIVGMLFLIHFQIGARLLR